MTLSIFGAGWLLADGLGAEGMLVAYLVAAGIIAVASLAGLWGVFAKAGRPGWAALIPFYNTAVLLDIAGKPVWWLILYQVPIVSLVIHILVMVELAKAFGKTPAYAAGLVLLPFVFLPWLGFGDARYQQPHVFTPTRILVMLSGGLFGLYLLGFGLYLAGAWWEYIGGGLETWQGKEGWRIWIFLLLVSSALAVMFLSLQLGRTEERTNPLLRRLLYGYNAVLSGILVLSILCVANVLAHAYFKPNYDWTTASIYSLSSRSENILEGLNKTTKIYVILPKQDELDTLRRMQALLDNCQAVSRKIQAEYLSPDIDRERITQLQDKYKFTDRVGILVVYGSEPNTEHQFIKGSALYAGSSPFGRQRDTRLFKGESELMTAISYVSEGKKKPVVYFTQGNGELDLGDMNSREIDRGLGLLKQRLEQDNVEVKGLQLSSIEGLKGKSPDTVISSAVPSNAAAVVVAGPQQTLPDAAVKALREYLHSPGTDKSKTKGKLIALLDVVPTQDKTRMQRTGLEELLADFNVQVGQARVLQIGEIVPNPMQVRVVTNPNPDVRSQNPVGAAFARTLFLFYNVRNISPIMKAQAGAEPSRYKAEVLLAVPSTDGIWAETDLAADPIELVRALRKRERRQELLAKISQDDISIGVAASEQTPTADPHASLEPAEGSPRIVAIGDSTFVSNWALQEGARGRNYDLFYSILSWLRERPSDVGIEARKQDVYEVDPINVNLNRMVYLPTALMVVGIIGLGTGVWVVRRK
jgi:hypothetical protein